MHLMIADEADQDGEKDFLVFSGVFFPSSTLNVLSKQVEQLRIKHGFTPGDKLKFSTGTKPKQVSRDAHSMLKNEILELAAVQQCKVCCYVVPNSIAKGQDLPDRLKFGANTLLEKFDQFLRESRSDSGLAFFDRTTDYAQDAYFRELFEIGVPRNNGERTKLQRIVAIDSTGIGHSHLISVTDIVVGAFRFVVNEPDKDRVGKVLMKQISQLMWLRECEGTYYIRERGLCIRPLDIRAPKYRELVDSLIKRVENYCNS